MLVEDCADGMLHVMDHSDESVTLINLGTEDTCSVRRIGEIVMEVMGLSAQMDYTGGDRGWAGDIPKARLAIDRLLATGFALTCHSEEAVRTTAALLFEEIAGSRVGAQD
jgi:UDP-glucose 4-epimerase